jgi:predicted protein tyrosine phosphatase
MSRKAIEKFCAIPSQEKTAVICICDSSDFFASLLYKPEYLLQLSFDDVDSDVFVDILGDDYKSQDTSDVEKQYHMFSQEQAAQVASFVKEVWDKVDVLVCQCEHGQSRSAAVAAAISEHKFKKGIDIFADERYYPNKFVFWRVFNKLNEVDK